MQAPKEIFMVRPAKFGFNSETATDNHYQSSVCDPSLAVSEFDTSVSTLRQSGLQVTVFQDTQTPPKPDAIFPNNWISCHESGEVILYPMAAENRRRERREDVVTWLKNNFVVTRVVDLSQYELQGKYLEGTGSIVFDHVTKTAYACVSHRTDPELLETLCREIGYKSMVVEALDADGHPIYHTNVFLAIGTNWVVVCLEAVQGSGRSRLEDMLMESGRKVVKVSQEQVTNLAANCYEVTATDNRAKLVMSTRAWSSLNIEQRDQLSQPDVDIVLCNIDTIERVGGGGIRCMLAPVFNKRRVKT